MLLAWAFIVGLSCYAYRAPSTQSDDVVDEVFSADRAEVYLDKLVGDSIPHPSGSKQNQVVRERIVQLFKSFGYSVEVQSGTAKVNPKVKDRSPDRDQVELHNIIAIRKSKKTANRNQPENQSEIAAKKIMLVSHYDSVPAGPGACDDGVATSALLEIARMLKQEPPPNRDIVFLVTDGEEFGLLGAKLFVAEHPLADEIGVVINLEARGTAGPCCMFETSRLSRHLIPIYSQIRGRKFASSLFLEIYKRLPRDTDFSVFKRANILGYNFAFIGNVKEYHSAADNLENADRGSLQHHGDNAIGLIRALLKDDQVGRLSAIDDSKPDEAVYFDFFGQWIVWWPSHCSIWMSGIALVLIGITCYCATTGSKGEQVGSDFANRGLGLSWLDVFKNLIIMFLAIVVVFFFIKLLQISVRMDDRLAHPWPANPTPMLLGYWLASFSITAVISLTLLRHWEGMGTWAALCIFWLALAIASSFLLNGASHLFVLPIFATALAGAAGVRRGHDGLAATIVTAAIAIGMMWLPLERIFYDAVGFAMPDIMCGRMAIVSTAVLSLLAVVDSKVKFWFAMLSSLSSVAAFVWAIATS